MIKIINKKIDNLKIYKNNPRINSNAIEYVKNSIELFGFKVPLVIDKYNNIITGHTRYEACKLLNLKYIPCIVADDLSEEQIRAFRLIDNKSNEKAFWDENKLQIELDKIIGIDMNKLNFLDNQKFEDLDIDLDNVFKERIEKNIICPNCGEEIK